MFTLNRRVALLSLGAAAALSLAGCAALNTVVADAQTFGSWPAGRQPGSFAFERLPSQQRNEANQASLEDAARGALLKAGFTESADPKAADIVVSLGARVTRSGPAPWDDPLWWRWNGSYWGWRYGPAWRPYYSRWGYSYPMDPMMERRYDREVAMLLREEDLGCSDLRRRVTSPGGTAAAGLAAMERGGVRGAIIDGVSAAMRRAGELG